MHSTKDTEIIYDFKDFLEDAKLMANWELAQWRRETGRTGGGFLM